MPAAEPLAFHLPLLFLHGVSAAAHILLALAVAGHLVCLRRGLSTDARAKDAGARRQARSAAFRCHGVAACATWALAAAGVLSAAYSCYLGLTGRGPGWSVVGLVDATARASAWQLLAACLPFEFGRRCEERFPAPLRLWWALFLLLSILAVAAHVAASLDGFPVPALLWALDAVWIVGAVVLLSAGLLGRRECGCSASEEPLLNGGAHEAASDSGSGAAETSLFTSAGFLSKLSFSWMAPLLAVGNKKTLRLDDVPALDPANLEALTGDISGSGQKSVTAFKLTKALVRTVWWQVVLSAFYALICNVATHVGPYLMLGWEKKLAELETNRDISK